MDPITLITVATAALEAGTRLVKLAQDVASGRELTPEELTFANEQAALYAAKADTALEAAIKRHGGEG